MASGSRREPGRPKCTKTRECNPNRAWAPAGSSFATPGADLLGREVGRPGVPGSSVFLCVEILNPLVLTSGASPPPAHVWRLGGGETRSANRLIVPP